MDAITIRGLSKRFDDTAPPLEALKDISLSVQPGEFISILGPNGCGKTTFIKILAGLEKPTDGTIRFNGGSDAKVGYIVQDFRASLFPWLSVERNIAFALTDGTAGKRATAGMIKKLRLAKHRNAYPYQLSGGLSQLVAIGRALVSGPSLLLLDEPFSALDYRTGLKLQMELLKLLKGSRTTTFFVSHTVDEAILLADRVVIFSGPPAEVADIVDVGLPRPRKPEMLTSAAFNRLRRRVMKSVGGHL